MIQQHLDGDPTKRTVQNRLDELVELDVLDKYEYTNQTLYDLAYDPIVTDGGRLRDVNLFDLATFQDQRSIRDLAAGGMLLSLLFFGYGILTATTRLTGDISISGNFYMDAAIALYLVTGGILLVLWARRKVEPWLPGQSETI
jgi:hypothetical protein